MTHGRSAGCTPYPLPVCQSRPGSADGQTGWATTLTHAAHKIQEREGEGGRHFWIFFACSKQLNHASHVIYHKMLNHSHGKSEMVIENCYMAFYM